MLYKTRILIGYTLNLVLNRKQKFNMKTRCCFFFNNEIAVVNSYNKFIRYYYDILYESHVPKRVLHFNDSYSLALYLPYL